MLPMRLIAAIAIFVLGIACGGTGIISASDFYQHPDGQVIDSIDCDVTIETCKAVETYSPDNWTPLEVIHFGTVARGCEYSEASFRVRNTGVDPVSIRPYASGTGVIGVFSPECADIPAGEFVVFDGQIGYTSESHAGKLNKFQIEIIEVSGD